MTLANHRLDTFPPGAPGARDWRVLLEDPRPNALLIGSSTALDTALRQLLSVAGQPVLNWDPRLQKEPSLTGTDTLVIREVDALDAFQQRHLFDALGAQNIRVLSLASAPLYPLVQRGDFLEALYYRLNVVCLEVASS